MKIQQQHQEEEFNVTTTVSIYNKLYFQLHSLTSKVIIILYEFSAQYIPSIQIQ